MKLKSPYLIKPHSKVKLSNLSTSDHDGFADKGDAEPVLAKHRHQLSDLQDVFYASQKKALLIVLQGMDTAGKDGTISHIFSGINPQGCDVAAFKVPTPLEARHYFLWRCQVQTPPRGMIMIFNRSHYEDVLSPRVHGLINTKTARERMQDINKWESSRWRITISPSSSSSCTSRTPSRPAACSPASTIRTSTGSSLPRTLRSGSSGASTPMPTKTSSPTPAESMHRGL
jgi:polyphosphate kinase 2 (PPK2 family)